MDFAKDFGMTPWEAEEQCSEYWWAWWKAYRNEQGRIEKEQIKKQAK